MHPIREAENNRGPLRQRYDVSRAQVVAANPLDAAEEFQKRMSAWTVSMNMRANDLEEFLDLGHHRNIYEKVSDELSAYAESPTSPDPGLTFEEALEKDLKKWYSKRKAYRDAIHEETHLKYGAICAEGNGLGYYGPFAVFLLRSAVAGYAELFVLREDSLNYVDSGNCFDELRYRGDLSLRDNLMELAVVKHTDDLLVGCDHAMRRHCYAHSSDDRCYLEAQVYDDVLREHVEEVRWPKKLEDEMLAIARRKFDGLLDFSDKKDECDSMIYERHKRITRKIRTFELRITIFEP